uniref:EB domain-containing protein n=1 Tax=Haemonchus contortus TaxID=6289 RepID=A0A7I5E8H6_HAECO
MISEINCFLLLLPLCLGIAKVCVSDSSCPSGMQCTPATNGYSICMKTDEAVEQKYPTPPSFYCNTNKDCAQTQICVRLTKNPGNCLESKSSGSGVRCNRNSDCDSNMRCVDYHGQWQCLELDIVMECSSTVTCESGKECVYHDTEKRSICVDATEVSQLKASPSIDVKEATPTEFAVDGKDSSSVKEDFRPVTVVPTISWRIAETSSVSSAPQLSQQEANHTNSTEGRKVMAMTYTEMSGLQPATKNSVLDSAALPCEFDYQCRMGESCSGVIALVDRQITVCQYDETKTNRQCIYHADCLQGQRCLRNDTDVFVCTPSMEAALGTVSCTYDYECSGGEKCMKVAQEGEKVFRCRPSQVVDPRRDQLCQSNADCAYQQVCRRVAGVSLCVDVASTPLFNVQKKIVTFIKNLLFSKK